MNSPEFPPNYFNGLNEKLLARIPSSSRRVLEFGCANGRLGAAFKQRNPQARWTGVDINDDALRIAGQYLDEVIRIDLNSGDPSLQLRQSYDCIVFGDLLEHLVHPEAFLHALSGLAEPDAVVVCCVPNMAHASVIARMLSGDVSYDDAGLLDSTHLRFLSHASVTKMFLDNGWLPNVADSYVVGHQQEFIEQLCAAGGALGIPRDTLLRNVLLYQLIMDCRRSPAPSSTSPRDDRISVVVPITNQQQFELNIARSPGLREIGAEIIPVQGAPDPAQALDAGMRHARGTWILFCHQDVYVPRGSGHMLQQLASTAGREDPAGTLIGFAGLRADAGAGAHAGLVIDRLSRFDHPRAEHVASLDEFAILLSRQSLHRIDGSIGWHAWGTDLCLAARSDPRRKVRVERVPLFHNSYNDSKLTEGFHQSIRRLFDKYPGVDRLDTLNGSFERPRAQPRMTFSYSAQPGTQGTRIDIVPPGGGA